MGPGMMGGEIALPVEGICGAVGAGLSTVPSQPSHPCAMGKLAISGPLVLFTGVGDVVSGETMGKLEGCVSCLTPLPVS